MIDVATDFASNAIVFLAFLAAVGAAFAWMYRKVWRPIATKIERILELTEYELNTNGGSSLLDKVNRIALNHETAQKHWVELESSHREIIKRLEKIELATATPEVVP